MEATGIRLTTSMALPLRAAVLYDGGMKEHNAPVQETLALVHASVESVRRRKDKHVGHDPKAARAAVSAFREATRILQQARE
jgi:hypothetical protein